MVGKALSLAFCFTSLNHAQRGRLILTERATHIDANAATSKGRGGLRYYVMNTYMYISTHSFHSCGGLELGSK